ncbi:uncharacterized protein LOC131233666 isoform X2 [Magnolia sinica]|uniref:uncharacterized protein LOC131233666 isoform X2 n=1 Tax=Magnolia sinica TaxID=86752 RepID=UPI0026581D26|nr:uncharacterized protein LOC131233666 isoform X2 [Magnolia sinica]
MLHFLTLIRGLKMFWVIARRISREISAENLGPKFGQFGSFLPVLLQNPLMQSQHKSLASTQTQNKVENIHSTSTCKGFKRDRSLSLAQVCEDSTPKHETIVEKSRVCDKKTLKIHLKVGVGEVPKRNSAGHKKCNMQDCPNITKRRKVGWANGVTNDVVGVQKESTELDNLKQLVKKATPSSSNDVVNAQGLQSLVGKDYSLAEKTLKEAIDLKHSADRLKNGESEVEVSGIYLRAALKFLLAASMFEVRDMGSIALGERTQSTNIYIDTPKILKQCAISFESTGEIAAAALVYKCMEVAYMRVIFSMSSHIRRDSRKLQASLHGHPFGQESSPSSAIDATNIHEDGVLPGSKAKGVEPLASKATCSSMHLLNYVEYVRSAIDATQRSLSALKVAQLKYRVGSCENNT